MAHKKAGGAKARQGANVAGKRLGLKVTQGSVVKPGQILIRQRGRQIIPGTNVGMGKDFTIFSKIIGAVNFKVVGKNKRKVEVIEKA